MKYIIILSLTLLAFSVKAQDQKQQFKLNIQIEGLETPEGTLMIEIVDENEKPYKSIKEEVSDATCKLSQELPMGNYMVQYYHDANNNAKMDKMFMGIPKEGYGFSNNPDSKYGPPAFEKMLFSLASDTLIVINNVQW